MSSIGHRASRRAGGRQGEVRLSAQLLMQSVSCWVSVPSVGILRAARRVASGTSCRAADPSRDSNPGDEVRRSCLRRRWSRSCRGRATPSSRPARPAVVRQIEATLLVASGQWHPAERALPFGGAANTSRGASHACGPPVPPPPPLINRRIQIARATGEDDAGQTREAKQERLESVGGGRRAT